MKCVQCGSIMIKSTSDYFLPMPGKDIKLYNMTCYICDVCGEDAAVIPSISKLCDLYKETGAAEYYYDNGDWAVKKIEG